MVKRKFSGRLILIVCLMITFFVISCRSGTDDNNVTFTGSGKIPVNSFDGTPLDSAQVSYDNKNTVNLDNGFTAFSLRFSDKRVYSQLNVENRYISFRNSSFFVGSLIDGELEYDKLVDLNSKIGTVNKIEKLYGPLWYSQYEEKKFDRDTQDSLYVIKVWQGIDGEISNCRFYLSKTKGLVRLSVFEMDTSKIYL